MQNSKKENLTIALILGILSVAVIYSANQIPAGGSLGKGADFLPKIIGWLLLLCSGGFLYQGIRIREPGTEGKPDARRDHTALIRFFAALGLLILYAALLKRVGFVVMTAAYIFAQSQLMVPSEKRSYPISFVLAVVSSIAIHLIFTRGLGMILPAGILDGIL